jgi:hypothetical protein
MIAAPVSTAAKVSINSADPKWIENRLEELADIFAVPVGVFR